MAVDSTNIPKLKSSWIFHRHSDSTFKAIMAASSIFGAVVLAMILCTLAVEAWPALKEFGLGFLATETWDPVRNIYGAISSIYGTLVSSLIALVIAIPLSIGIALCLTQMLPTRISQFVGSAIELLAAIPSIIFGMWGLFVFAPFMAEVVQPFLANILGFTGLFSGPQMGIGILSAGIILSLMILPYMTAVIRDVLNLVPAVLKESAYGIGATSWEVTSHVMMPYGIQGIVGACFIGLGRALGETMAVTFVIGNNHQIVGSLFGAGNSIASTLANEFSEAFEPLHVSSLMALGLILLGIALVVQIVSQVWLKRIHTKMQGRA